MEQWTEEDQVILNVDGAIMIGKVQWYRTGTCKRRGFWSESQKLNKTLHFDDYFYNSLQASAESTIRLPLLQLGESR